MENRLRSSCQALLACIATSNSNFSIKLLMMKMMMIMMMMMMMMMMMTMMMMIIMMMFKMTLLSKKIKDFKCLFFFSIGKCNLFHRAGQKSLRGYAPNVFLTRNADVF